MVVLSIECDEKPFRFTSWINVIANISATKTLSILAEETFPGTHGFAVASTLCLAENDIFGRIVLTTFYTDLRSLFDCLTYINSATAELLLMGLQMLRRSYESREVIEEFWIPLFQNPAEKFTKPNLWNAFHNFPEKNFYALTPYDWAQGTDTSDLELQPYQRQ